jgi:hypothetical protein
MKSDSDDSLAVALRMMQQAVAGSDAGSASDIVELYLTELRARRKRLEHWIRLLNAQARLRPASDQQAPKRRTAAQG